MLVCGHGTRDACCALRGTAVYSRLADHLGDDELWISSHQGGHRFATNVLVLPSGIQLGRVPLESAPASSRKPWRDGSCSITTEGVSRAPAPVQAAEARSARPGLEGWRTSQLVDVDGTVVRFRGP